MKKRVQREAAKQLREPSVAQENRLLRAENQELKKLNEYQAEQLAKSKKSVSLLKKLNKQYDSVVSLLQE